jgi:hypothetical protein
MYQPGPANDKSRRILYGTWTVMVTRFGIGSPSTRILSMQTTYTWNGEPINEEIKIEWKVKFKKSVIK